MQEDVLFCRKEPKDFCSSAAPEMAAMAGMLPRAPGTKVFCFFSSEKKTRPFLDAVMRREPPHPDARFLLVLCHGLGADSGQLGGLAARWGNRFPQAACFCADAPNIRRGRFWRADGRQWFSIRQTRGRQMAEAARSAAWLNARVDAELALRRLPAGAVLYCGFSQGAMISLLAGLQRRIAPLGIVGLAGSLMVPPGPFQPGCRPPVLLVHGAEDNIVPAARSEEAAVRLGEAGVPVKLEILAGLGHLIVDDAETIAAAFIAETCA